MTRKGLHTRAALLETAGEVFKDLGYYGASVSEICRRSGMSQGAFYQYFKNKEQALQELHDVILEKFWLHAEDYPDNGNENDDALKTLIGVLVDHNREYSYFHRILGEFELIDPLTIGYFDSIARFCRKYIRRGVNEGRLRPVDPNLAAYALIGISIFHSMEWGPPQNSYPRDEVIEFIEEFILRGIKGGKKWDRPKDLTAVVTAGNIEPHPESLRTYTQGQVTARAILQAAEKVFGEFGFNRAGIADITREAGVAQGTFYVHFKSKRDLMEGFVRYLSREMRRELKIAGQGIQDRRDVECAGIRAFFGFLSSHRRIYRVVGESETMGREMAMWYYKKLAEGYEPGLEDGVEKDEIRGDLPVPFMVRSIMGMVHNIGLKWLVWNSAPQAEFPRTLLAETIGIIIDGLEP